MPTVECRDCKHIVSTSAEVCPNCGAKYPAALPSKITVHRQRTFFAILAKLIVFVDGKEMGRLGNNESTSFDIMAGDHTFLFKYDLPGNRSAEVPMKIMGMSAYQVEAALVKTGVQVNSYKIES